MPKTVKPEDNIFEAFDCEDSYVLEVKAALILELRSYIRLKGITQRQAAEFFGTHQPRINDLMKRRIDKFTIDALVNMLAKAGRSVKVEILEPA